MASISSTSSDNISNLLQTLSPVSPQYASILNTPKVQAALEQASPRDIAEISSQALELQQVGFMFGPSDATQPADSAFQALESSLEGGQATSGSQTQSQDTLLAAMSATDSLFSAVG